MKFTFKYPDEDDITEEQINSISNFIYEFEDDLLAGEPIEKYADIATFAAWMLCHDILGTADSEGCRRADKSFVAFLLAREG